MPSRSLATIALVALASYAPAAEPEGWIDLLKTGPESPWKAVDKGWITTKEVKLDTAKPNRLTATADEPGEWQTLDVTFRAPKIDDKGEKTANATIVKATLNGQLIHENQEMKTPTGNNYTKKEVATWPFMLQSDHGPVAWRNAKIREVAMK